MEETLTAEKNWSECAHMKIWHLGFSEKDSIDHEDYCVN